MKPSRIQGVSTVDLVFVLLVSVLILCFPLWYPCCRLWKGNVQFVVDEQFNLVLILWEIAVKRLPRVSGKLEFLTVWEK